MTDYFPLIKIRMANQSNQYTRLHYTYSLQTLSCFITFIILLQGPIIIIAQPNQYESVIALNNNNIRSSSITSTILNNNNNDAIAYDADIYDDDTEDDHEQMPSSSLSSITTTTTTTISNSRLKTTSNITSYIPAHVDEGHHGEYVDGDESDSYPNEDNNQDGSQVFDEKISVNDPDMNSVIPDSNNKKDSDFSSTSRIPFVPSNLWRDLFSKPGILVGIIGGVVIGMLSAILLVMFIIYRMRKKDEGSYALEEGPRKSPSHAYTRVSSREFFA